MKILLPDQPTPADLRRYFLFAAFKGEQGQEPLDRGNVLLGENPFELYSGATQLRQVDRQGLLAFDKAMEQWRKKGSTGIVFKSYLFDCSECGWSSPHSANLAAPGKPQYCDGDSGNHLNQYDDISAIVWNVEDLLTDPALLESQIQLEAWFNPKKDSEPVSDTFAVEYLDYIAGRVSEYIYVRIPSVGRSYKVLVNLSDLPRMNGTDGLLKAVRINHALGKAQDLVLI